MIHDIGCGNGEFIISPNDFKSFIIRHSKDNFIRLENWEKSKSFLALTIDDVPEGFYHYGFPILKQYQIPFTLFVNIELLNTPNYITTDMLEEMNNSGLVTIGSHGLTHGYFRDLSKSEKNEYLQQSKLILEQLCCSKISLFAYPYGSIFACGLSGKSIVHKYYSYGFGTIATAITSPLLFSKYFLPRINITPENINFI